MNVDNQCVRLDGISLDVQRWKPGHTLTRKELFPVVCVLAPNEVDAEKDLQNN